MKALRQCPCPLHACHVQLQVDAFNALYPELHKVVTKDNPFKFAADHPVRLWVEAGTADNNEQSTAKTTNRKKHIETYKVKRACYAGRGVGLHCACATVLVA